MELFLFINYSDGFLLYVQVRAYVRQVVICLAVRTFISTYTVKGLK